MKKYLEVKNLSKTYIGGYIGINQVDFELEEGETLAIVGGNGSGKTTILSLLAGLEMPSSGEILLDGRNLCDISIKNREIGYISKELQLDKLKTCKEIIMYPLKIRKVDRNQMTERVLEIAEMCEISHLLDTKIKNLTYFDKIKVCLARVLTVERKLYLIDNIFDRLTQNEMDSICKIVSKIFENKTLILAFEKVSVANQFCKSKQIYLGYGASLGVADIHDREIFKGTLEGAKLLYDRKVCCIPCTIKGEEIHILDKSFSHNYTLKSDVFDEAVLLLKMDAIHFDKSRECVLSAQIDFVNKDNIGYFDIDYKIATINLANVDTKNYDKLDFSFNINDGILYDYESERRIST